VRALPLTCLSCRAPHDTVDDGSALFPCIWWHDSFERRYGSGRSWFSGLSPPPFKLGNHVSVCGQVKRFRGELQLRVDAAWVEDDPDAEAMWHCEVAHLMDTYYRQQHSPTPGGAAAVGTHKRRKRPAQEASSDPSGTEQPPGTSDVTIATLLDAICCFMRGRDEFRFSELPAAQNLRVVAEEIASRPQTLPCASMATDTATRPVARATETRVAHIFTRCIGTMVG
jgi:hypothetical protein